jgi:23S rRNA pseudouridine2605 synthase
MKKKTGFEKFHKVKSGSALKEQIRQEKKKITKERKEYFEAKRKEEYDRKSGVQNRELGLRSSGPIRNGGSKLQTQDSSQMPLNKFIAHSGVCSRRDAAELIKTGKIKVNGEVVTEPGRKVTVKDNVTIGAKRIYPVADLVYILLNKPKDYLTTTDDPQQRKTVLDLIVGATKDRVYPVGRLDRNTSGVLLLTNDGELAQKLTHPSNEIKKVYAVTLNRPLEKKHFEEILKGVELEDGMAHVDILAYTDAQDKTQIGVEIHSGRNRIVRRIFEKFGYDVKALDRVMFAGLTKKNVNRGKWRYLNEKEVRDLKYFKKGKS